MTSMELTFELPPQIDVLKYLSKWYDTIHEKPKNRWTELPLLPGLKFKNLRMKNADTPILSNIGVDAADVSIQFVYDEINEINNEETTNQ